ncbi:hypothetical protein [Streptomyces subrutilus]|uniref:hypothetical protein n=1 Tax=Streptomyces subrutilus TaxID=36818 RepID=UPI0033C95C9E
MTVERTATALTTTGLLLFVSGAVLVVLIRTSKRRLWCTTAGAERLEALRRLPSSALTGVEPVLAGVAVLGVGQLHDPALEAAMVGHGRSDRGSPVDAATNCGSDFGGGYCGGDGGGDGD